MERLPANRCVIEPMTRKNIDAVLEIERESGLSLSAASEYEVGLTKPENILLVARNGEKIEGFLSARLITSAVEILDVAVAAKARRCGTGAALLTRLARLAVEKGADECWLEVRAGNETAQKFYLAHRFEIVGRRKKYYSNPVEDAILMTLIFSDENPKK